MKRHTIEQKEEYRVHVDTMETKANIVQQTGWSLGVDVVTVEREAAVEVAMQLLEFAGWQQMETAPKDGTLILAQRDRGDPVTAFYDDTPGTDRWCLATGERMGWTELTGWLPLPEITEVEG